MVRTTAELRREFTNRASAAGLQIDCLGDGAIDAKILIVAEAPGIREVEMKMPLVGASGQLLWSTLSKFGITRSQCYVTNVVKHMLLEKKQINARAIPKNEQEHWNALLRWEMEQLPNVQYVIVLGNYALEALIGVDGVDKYRGSVLHNDGKYYIIANNPAHILRKSYLEPVFQLDIYKLRMVMQGDWQEYDVQHLFDPSPREAISWCDKMIQERKPVSFDIEVISGETTCVGFANDAHVGMCINFRGRDHNRWTIREERDVRYAIQRVLRHKDVQLVAQNGAFDCEWLWYKDRIKAKPLYIDTLLAHHTLYPIWPHNLGFLTAQYTTHPFYKDDKDEWKEGGDISSFWMYNVKDVCITWEVARRIEQELHQANLWNFYRDHVMRLQPHLIAATVLGNRIDLQMREQLNADYSASVDRLRAKFVELARQATNDPTLECNPNSPQQLAALLFQRLKLTGKTAKVDKTNITAMAESLRTPEHIRELLNTLSEYKREHKLLTTYITAKVDDDNRMRSTYKQFGTQFVPGRLSSAQTLWGSGMNLQNQPERLRGMFIADVMDIP